MTNEQVDKIARVCHAANREYARILGDTSIPEWDQASAGQRNSLILGVHFRVDNPAAPVEAQHERWLEHKVATGWVYGAVKDEEKKTHPCLLPYTALPAEQRLKDELFVAVVRALTSTLFPVSG